MIKIFRESIMTNKLPLDKIKSILLTDEFYNFVKTLYDPENICIAQITQDIVTAVNTLSKSVVARPVEHGVDVENKDGEIITLYPSRFIMVNFMMDTDIIFTNDDFEELGNDFSEYTPSSPTSKSNEIIEYIRGEAMK